MFNRKLKKQVELLEKKVTLLQRTVLGTQIPGNSWREYDGLTHDVSKLKAELPQLKKLQALLNEVIDHVYKENK